MRSVNVKTMKQSVSDHAFHLVQYVRDRIGQELVKTPAMTLLDSTPISVDRSHSPSRVGTFCRRTTNTDKNSWLYCLTLKRK